MPTAQPSAWPQRAVVKACPLLGSLEFLMASVGFSTLSFFFLCPPLPPSTLSVPTFGPCRRLLFPLFLRHWKSDLSYAALNFFLKAKGDVVEVRAHTHLGTCHLGMFDESEEKGQVTRQDMLTLPP